MHVVVTAASTGPHTLCAFPGDITQTAEQRMSDAIAVAEWLLAALPSGVMDRLAVALDIVREDRLEELGLLDPDMRGTCHTCRVRVADTHRHDVLTGQVVTP